MLSTEVTVRKERGITRVSMRTVTNQKTCTAILDPNSVSQTVTGLDRGVGLVCILKVLQENGTDQEVVGEDLETVQEKEPTDQEVHQLLTLEVPLEMVDGGHMIEKGEVIDLKAHQEGIHIVPRETDLEEGHMIDTTDQKLDQEAVHLLNVVIAITRNKIQVIAVCLDVGLGRKVGLVILPKVQTLVEVRRVVEVDRIVPTTQESEKRAVTNVQVMIIEVPKEIFDTNHIVIKRILEEGQGVETTDHKVDPEVIPLLETEMMITGVTEGLGHKVGQVQMLEALQEKNADHDLHKEILGTGQRVGAINH